MLCQWQQQLDPLAAHLRRGEVRGDADDGECELGPDLLTRDPEGQPPAERFGGVGIRKESIGKGLRDHAHRLGAWTVIDREPSPAQ